MNDWKERERVRLAAEIGSEEHSYTDKGVRRWRKNDRPIPPDIYRDAGLECPKAQKDAHESETSAFIAEYKRVNANRRPSAEEQFEMRAAFGPGQTVVDIFTGQKFET